MNSTFKVVFNKARGALMVVNEVTSSVQAKGTKTVVATAVAAMIAGVAGTAMATQGDQKGITIGDQGVVEVTGATGAAQKATGAVKVIVEGATATATEEKDWVVNTTTVDDVPVTIAGGELKVVGHSLTIAELTSDKGTLTVGAKADGLVVGTLTVTNDDHATYKDLTVNLNTVRTVDADDQEMGNATLAFDANKNVTIQSGAINITGTDAVTTPAATAWSGQGTGTVDVAGELTLGVASVASTGTKAKVVQVSVDEKTKGAISAAGLNLANIDVTNNGELTFTSDKAAEATVAADVVIGKESVLSNVGKLTFASTNNQVAFNADYTAGEKGQLIVTSADGEKGGVTVGGAIKAGKIGLGVAADTTTAVILNGGTVNGVTVAKTGSIEATDTLTLKGATTNQGSVIAAKTVVDTAATFVNAYKETNGVVDYEGVTNFGEMTVDAAAFELTNEAPKAAVEADKLTVKGTGGAFTLSEGAFSTAALTNAGTVTLNGTTAATFTVTGASENGAAGKIVLTNTAKDNLVVAEGATLTNKGVIAGNEGGTTSNGTLTVAGTLSNEKTVNVGTLDVAGTYVNVKSDTITDAKLTATELNIKKGGTVQTALDAANFAVTTTTVEGTLATTLNAVVAGTEMDGITVANAIVLKDGGAITAGGADVVNFDVAGATAKLEVASGKFDLNTVKLGDTTSKFAVGDDAVVSLKALNATSATAASQVTVGGVLSVADAIKTAGTAATIKVSGDLNASLKALGYKLDESGAFATEASGGSVANGTITIDQNGEFALTDFADAASVVTLKQADISTLKGKIVGTGLIDLGNVTTTELNTAISGGKVAYSALSTNYGRITTDTLKTVIVTGVTDDGIAATQSYGKVELNYDATPTEHNLKIGDGATLTLNNAGALVTYKDGTTLTGVTFASETAKLVTTNDSEIGMVGDDLDNGALDVSAKTLTVKGNVKVAAVSVAEGATLQIEQVADVTKAHKVELNTLAVSEGATFNAEQNTVTLTTTQAATLAAGSPNKSEILGTASIGTLAASDVTLSASNVRINPEVKVGSDKVAASLSLGELGDNVSLTVGSGLTKEGTNAVSRVAVKSNKSTHSLHIVDGAVVGLGTADLTYADAALNKVGFEVAYTAADADRFETRTVDSFVAVVGNASGEVLPLTGHVEGAGVAGSMMYIDGTTVDTTGTIGVFAEQRDLEFGSILYLDNVTNGDKVKMSNTGSNIAANVFFSGDMLMTDEVEDGTVSIGMVDRRDIAREIGEVVGLDAAYGMFEEGKNVGNNSASAQFNSWLYSSLTTPVRFKNSEGKYVVDAVALKQITNDVGALGATTGVQAVTMDAVSMMAGTAAARTTILNQKAEGAQVWAEVNGGSFEAKKLFNGAGYSSDIWAGSIGVDYTAACGGTLGAALTIGTADTDSKNTGVKSSTDSDLVGFTVYASQTFNDVLGVAADLGYLKASNDVSASGYDHAWKFAQDTDAFTFGLRGEVLTKVGAVNIIPHAGLRWTRISTDEFEAGYTTDVSSMNVFQLPLGVTVSGEFEAADWTIAPKFDLSVVPAFGDKDAELKLGIAGVSATDDLAVRVVDSNPVQATLGVSATTGAWAFGLNYKLGVGSDSRMNNTFNANVRYAF